MSSSSDFCFRAPLFASSFRGSELPASLVSHNFNLSLIFPVFPSTLNSTSLSRSTSVFFFRALFCQESSLPFGTPTRADLLGFDADTAGSFEMVVVVSPTVFFGLVDEVLRLAFSEDKSLLIWGSWDTFGRSPTSFEIFAEGIAFVKSPALSLEESCFTRLPNELFNMPSETSTLHNTSSFGSSLST